MIQIAGNYQFFYSNIDLTLFRATVNTLFSDSNQQLKKLSIVLLSDEDIREMNKRALDHDYYTDILTFDLSETVFHVETELYISYDRVKENAQSFKQTNRTELLRVTLHGCLHIAGYKDKTKKEIEAMRTAENKYIQHYKSQSNGKTI
ncbi:rRNA maturation RNase YbeY [Bacteroidia bacterium]|nr:rRNA maturation RNase YbeY [Bacteroidia bacterium]